MRYGIRMYSFALSILFLVALPAMAQNASLVGTVKDQQDASMPNVTVSLTNLDSNIAQTSKTDAGGSYEFSFVRPGRYTLKAEQTGFKTFVQAAFTLAVDQRLRIDPVLQIGDASATVTVEATPTGVQTESSSLGSVVENKKIVEIPLNGRFFLDLALLQAGTVVSSTNNRTFLAVPSGIGASGINASGTREDSTNYLVDGINLSDMVQNQITFQPNIDMLQEFKVQTNSFNAEYGRNAGIIVNAVSKSGSNSFHGTAFEFVRNERFDAKNFFDDPLKPIAPFKRNIYGYSFGGPLIKNKTFFFTSYEGREGREVATLNSLTPTAAQRAAVTNPIVLKLLTILPAANDSTGTRFLGSAPRKRELNQFTGRVDHNISSRDIFFANFISNRDSRTEPTLQGNTLPGFGDFRPARRYLAAIGETHVFSPTVTNEFRAGLNRVRIDFDQAFLNTPAEFGITSPSAVFPQIAVSGAFTFGGINGFPQGRGDTATQASDTVSWVKGKQTIKFGAEFRHFNNDNLNGGTGGTITFGSLAAFLAGTPSSATEAALPATPALAVSAFNTFVQDDIKLTKRLTVNLGLRWEYNGVPEERYNRLGVYVFSLNKVVQVGTNGIERPYDRRFTDFAPRVGFAYDPFGKGKTVIRAGAGLYYDQPVTNTVSGLDNNPPFSTAVNNTSNVNLASPFAVAPGTGAAIQAIDPDFRSGRVLSYNFNIQHEIFGTVLQATYVGSQGRHLRIIGDINQGINGLRPIAGFTSITDQQSISNSNYNGLWLQADKRLAKGLTFSTSYTFSKSIDNNSVGSSNPQAQDYRNLAGERALSDFDARHRFVLSGVYELPLKWEANGLTKRLASGWSIAPIVNLQSGNPFSPIVPLTATLAPGAAPVQGVIYNSGSLEGFDRPSFVPGQPIYPANQSPQQWFNPLAFTRNSRGFGNVGRNALVSPGFQDIDVAIRKNTSINERVLLQFRAEAFNLFNHPNFSQPGSSAGQVFTSSQFGQITATRATRGDLGSSRQLQLGVKLIF